MAHIVPGFEFADMVAAQTAGVSNKRKFAVAWRNWKFIAVDEDMLIKGARYDPLFEEIKYKAKQLQARYNEREAILQTITSPVNREVTR
ncbi:hypothetical protein SEMRO_569_G168380.1 [Seminavis robusta]|uniref:Uncharacterized protein n=1 Tax=Seminavis robusta TaxID=568900 RepID=A0A9N8HFG6_9STRA|nr:hypothetical protein SEMRO_569_G168380.1 [Seminavis robusta]|eukprot:Sro569_g168380.1 n/a (89) ;mRNA; r:42174-42440